jgi:hypothetical protein
MRRRILRLPPESRQPVKTTVRHLMHDQRGHLYSSRCLMIVFLLLGSLIGAQASISDRLDVNLGAPISPGGTQSEFPTLTPSSFGFQCGTVKPTNCPNETWPTTVAQPGMIRLWDSQVQWHSLNSGRGAYNWKTLDGYLDAIAAHQPRDAMYTFGYTPCWDTRGQCKIARGSASPPDDLTASGSPSFNTFVTALVNHCSPAGHCVKDTIKYWEMWNEPNAEPFWTGTVPQLYELMAPAIPIIRSKVPGALVLTPPVMRADTSWMQKWLNEENTRGRLSDIFSFHLYLLSDTPETRFGLIKRMVDMKNKTTDWNNTPWINSETGFDPYKFVCDSRYASEDCVGQMVRWHVLHFAYGAQHLSWFFFNTTIGRNTEFANAYKTMMEWLVGGRFTAECSAKGDVYTCPFIQANGHHALLVWSTSGKGTYPPATQHVDYKDLSGNTTKISPGRPVTIGVKPVMFEAAN